MFDSIKIKYFKSYITNELKTISGLPNDKVKLLVEDFNNLFEKAVTMYATENKIPVDQARKEVIDKIEKRVNESKHN